MGNVSNAPLFPSPSISAELSRNSLARRIIAFDSVKSTNLVAKRMVSAGAKEGTLIIAETQTAGRGRRQRLWLSPPGKGLWFSLILSPALSVDQSGILQIAAGVAVAKAIFQTTQLRTRLKWPNDVQIDGKKVCGILTETDSGLKNCIILGIGINVNQTRDEFLGSLQHKATSLAIEKGHPVDRAHFFCNTLHCLERSYADIKTGDYRALREQWLAHCIHHGQSLEIEKGGKSIRGVFAGIDDFGALRLQTENNMIKIITSGSLLETGK